jgi:hypothetical protein
MRAAYDFRDLVIEDLADQLVLYEEQIGGLAERAARAEAHRDAYRLVAVQAIHHSNDLHQKTLRLEQQANRLRDELRDIRGRFVLGDGGRNRAA